MPVAIVATLSEATQRTLAEALTGAGWTVALRTDDGEKALAACRTVRPDAVIADLVLPGLDGKSLAKRVRSLNLPLRPAVVICVWPGMEPVLPFPGAALAHKPETPEEILRLLRETRPENRTAPEETQRYLDGILNRLGVPEHPGRVYLADAAFLAGENRGYLSRLTAELYPVVARRNDVGADAVERAMRHVIEEAFSHGNLEEQYRLFRDTIDAAKGKPTCGEMIAQLSELLRMEG